MSQHVTGSELAQIATVRAEQPSYESPSRQREQFRRHGIMTATGRLSAKEASIQMLMLPVFILLWAVVVAIIAAVV